MRCWCRRPGYNGQAESATRQIVLIGGEELASLMIRHKVGTRVVATVDLQEVDGAFFGD